MSNDVERLKWTVKRLTEAVERMNGASTYSREVRHIVDGVREALAGSTTLPTPPRATPLEAAVRNRLSRMPLSWGATDALTRESLLRDMARDITAAVGALSEDAMWSVATAFLNAKNDRLYVDDARRILLARLTEGGTA